MPEKQKCEISQTPPESAYMYENGRTQNDLKTKNLPSSAKYSILRVKNETCKQLSNYNYSSASKNSRFDAQTVVNG
jgi:hypothetical protein